MITFQTVGWQLDLSNFPITFNEKNPYFYDETSKSYSYPFNLKVTNSHPVDLQQLTFNNVSNYKVKIYGTLVLDKQFFDAYIAVNDVTGNTLELTLYYGKETLSVFDKKLNTLPFPVIYAASGLSTFAKSQITKSWPDATHNFPMVYREQLKEGADFEQFQLFVNHYYNNDGTYQFLENSYETVESEQVAYNRNVMCPFPYLLEVVKQVFKYEGLDIGGDFVNDPINQKILMVPQNVMLQFAETQFLNYSFKYFNTQETIAGNTINVYKQVHSPLATGSYEIAMRINMNNVIAKYFHLTVTQNGVELYSAFSENAEVIIEKTLDINIVDTTVFDDIVVELKTSYTNESIEDYTSFTYQFTEGGLMVFPSVYNLADFMPDITVREFTNRIKTYFNLKFEYTDTKVYINYLENEINQLTFKDLTEYEQPEPARTLSKNNLFKLQLPNDDEVMVNKNGQTYTDTDYTTDETEEIKLKAQPLAVKSKQGVVTAVYPEDEEDIMFMLYNGPIANIPTATDNYNNDTLELQSIYERHWKNWLRFRANSEIYKDDFFMSIHDTINLSQGMFKYNKKHIIKTIERLRVNEQWWNIKVESETL